MHENKTQGEARGERGRKMQLLGAWDIPVRLSLFEPFSPAPHKGNLESNVEHIYTHCMYICIMYTFMRTHTHTILLKNAIYLVAAKEKVGVESYY